MYNCNSQVAHESGIRSAGPTPAPPTGCTGRIGRWQYVARPAAPVRSGAPPATPSGFPCALYTGNVAGHAEGHGGLARSTDGWSIWHKHKGDGERAASQRRLAGALGIGTPKCGRRASCGTSSSAVRWGRCRPAHRRAPVDLARPRGVDPPRHHRRGSRPRAACPTWYRSVRRAPGRRTRGADGRPRNTPTGPAATTGRRAACTPTGVGARSLVGGDAAIWSADSPRAEGVIPRFAGIPYI